MASFLLVPVLLYLAFLAILFFAQTALIFPVGQVAPAAPLPAAAERLEVRAASGERLSGIHIPPARPGPEPVLVLGFGGNATDAATTAALLHDLYPQADVAAFHYRGYPPSEGRPGAAALAEDALVIHDFLRARLRPARIVVAGFSVGGGVAAALAARRPVDGLILVTPFDSLAAVAAGHYPWMPVRLLLRHRLEPAADLRAGRVPVAIVAGGADTLVPPARTDALRRALPHLVFDRTLAGSGHNDIYADPAFPAAMREALRAVTADPR
ncbi:MAG TPA: alpha/beta hydrolase [Allosphingosinicella sp.]|nr:alpha/beta hydrolase [Allosphingosinicella sp.]